MLARWGLQGTPHGALPTISYRINPDSMGLGYGMENITVSLASPKILLLPPPHFKMKSSADAT